MEHREQLSRALRKIFWGYIFLYFDLNIATIDILPAGLGYIFFYQAIRDCLMKEDASTKLLNPICWILIIYRIIEWLMNIFQIPTDIFIITEMMSVIALYFHFQLLTNLANIAHKYECAVENTLLSLRTVHTILMTILAFTVHFKEIEWLSLLIMVAQVFIMVFICATIGKFRRAIDALPEAAFHELNIEI